VKLERVQAASSSCRLDIAGQSLELLPERGLWWPAGETLFVADLHLGKAASFRALGQPVPHGTTAQNLARLDRLIDQHRPRELFVLGDFLHDAQARTPQLLASLQAWREQHAKLRCTLVRGNHDSHAGDPPAALDFESVDEPWLTGPFAACHHPRPHPTHFVLAGHLHPVCKLQGSARDSLRMPCFVREERRLILPAFGEFTGGWLMEATPGRCFYGIGADAVWPLPI
jgi:DNA ligase-associated metallophosphoesterase